MNLIKNELVKISKKRTIIIIITIILAFNLAYALLQKSSLSTIYPETDWKAEVNESILSSESQLEQFRKEHQTDDVLNNIDRQEKTIIYNKFLLLYNLNNQGWKSEALRNYFITEITEYKSAGYVSAALDPRLCYEYYNNNDWKSFLQLKKQKFLETTQFKDQIELIDFLCENNIEPSAENWKYKMTQRMIISKKTISEARQSYITYGLTEPEIRTMEVDNEIYEYRILNNVPESEKVSFQSFLVSSTDLIVIVFTITIIIGCSIVTSEYSRGTIKQLLCFPYKRWKILLSKYVTTFLVSIALLIFLYLVTIITGLIFFGADGFNSSQLFYNGSKIVELNSLLYTSILYLIAWLELIMITSFSIMLSVVFKHTAIAVGAGVLVTVSGEVLALYLANIYRLDFVKYLFIADMNFRQFFVNKLTIPDLTLKLSIIMFVIYFIVFNGISLYNFTKKDIL